MCLEVNLLIENLTNICYSTSEQHRDLSLNRQTRDCEDTVKLVDFFEVSSPFKGNVQLRNVANGVTSSPGVNVDEAESAGKKILDKMSEKTLKEHVFKKKDQVTLMTTKKSGSSEVAHIDPALLFQRFIIVAKRSILKDDYFKFELCTIPPALFERNRFMRKANQPELAKAVYQLCFVLFRLVYQEIE